MNSILFYSPVIFQSLGFGSSAALHSSAITGGALVVAALISMALVDEFLGSWRVSDLRLLYPVLQAGS
ncbi:hypothetical protein BC332_24396 [Capsicum chinense]|nr:hypothetical protein BC332_24396 [Capsicum chinense]